MNMFNPDSFLSSGLENQPNSQEIKEVENAERFLGEIEKPMGRYSEALRNLQEDDGADLEYLEGIHEELVDSMKLLSARLNSDKEPLAQSDREVTEGVFSRVLSELGLLSDALETFRDGKNKEGKKTQEEEDLLH